MPPSKLIVGCGYLGLRVGRLWRDAGHSVVAVTRSTTRAAELFAEKFGNVQADVTRSETLRELSLLPALGIQLVSTLYSVGFDRDAGPDIHSVYADGLQNVLAALPPSVNRAIYISTTGVYGSAEGGWVDEKTPPDPRRDGGKASLAAEQVLGAHPLGRHSAILRLTGIYGPGRVPYIDQLRAGEPIAAPSEGWLNLIHVDDAAAIVVAVDQWLAAQPAADRPHVFCVSDGAPVIRGDYYGEVARLLGAPAPRFTEPAADSPAATRAGADRRVRSDKLRDTISVRMTYPSYREGLAAILDARA